MSSSQNPTNPSQPSSEDPETLVEPVVPPVTTTESTESQQERPTSRSSLIDPPRTVIEGETSEDDDSSLQKGEESWITTDSDIRDSKRRICIVTTAALPWRTGTAVNPLMRALYLTRGRPKHYVTLVIPWLNDPEDRAKTLGKEHRDTIATQEDQEAWIRTFCRERAGCPEEEGNLKIIFYKSKYYESFGSIFAEVDICALIPDQEADVAILEEPEHLNWLRVPEPYKEETEEKGKKGETNGHNSHSPSAKEKAELGWKFKFRHVVGIVHTNYKAYTEEYGAASKYITTPMLNALNSMVVRAYCHRVILLSETLPSLCPYKEITRNVHGVRGEFFEPPQVDSRPKEENLEPNDKGEMYAPVYFIGKTIWAKGFDIVLELEKLYREEHNEYFSIDVYGAGADEKAIQRAFFGRIPHIQQSKESKQESTEEADTAEIFTWNDSMRSHMSLSSGDAPTGKNDDEDKDTTDAGDTQQSSSSTNSESNKQRGSMIGFVGDVAKKMVPLSVIGDLSRQTFETTKATASAGVSVVKHVADAGKHVAFAPGSPSEKQGGGEIGNAEKPKMVFAPPRSVDEFRRRPLPARFLGSKDHALIRDIPEHKIFLNCSITEVLCTTTAEALAMGKFVILPKHPSNTFFYQFPNCLPYRDLKECLEKLEWAMQNDPKPLSKHTSHKLSWEGATDRLYEASAITNDELDEWEQTGKNKDDEDAARFHVETGMKGQLIQKYFGGVLRNGEKPEIAQEEKGK